MPQHKWLLKTSTLDGRMYFRLNINGGMHVTVPCQSEDDPDPMRARLFDRNTNSMLFAAEIKPEYGELPTELAVKTVLEHYRQKPDAGGRILSALEQAVEDLYPHNDTPESKPFVIKPAVPVEISDETLHEILTLSMFSDWVKPYRLTVPSAIRFVMLGQTIRLLDNNDEPNRVLDKAALLNGIAKWMETDRTYSVTDGAVDFDPITPNQAERILALAVCKAKD